MATPVARASYAGGEHEQRPANHARATAMTTLLRIAAASLVGLTLITSAVWSRSDEQKRTEGKGREVASNDTSAPVYKPPMRGSPGGRVGGGTRGNSDVLMLSVIAPDHTGRTARAQPSLFWFISAETKLPVELTIIKLSADPKDSMPVLEARLETPVERGIHRVRLADHGIVLAPNTTYQWSVAVIPDAARRSRDILASGTIERVDPDQELEPTFAGAKGEELVSRYAKAGYWYDALETVCDLIEQSPNDPAAQRNRAALLTQVGLSEAAR